MSYTKEESVRQFDSWSRTYDDSILQRLIFAATHEYLLAELGADGRPMRLLDVGCGTCNFLRRLLNERPGYELWGVDNCRNMISRGLPGDGEEDMPLRLIQGDSEALPVADNSFDVVTCSMSFHHYPNQAGAVAEMYRVLRPGGRLLIIDGYRDRPWGRLIYDVCLVAVEGAVSHASARRFRELLYEAGFTGMRQQARLGLAPFLLTVGTAAKTAKAAGQSLPPAVAA